MPDYRCYPVTLAGAIDGAGQVFDCMDDASAIEKAYATFFEAVRGLGGRAQGLSAKGAKGWPPCLGNSASPTGKREPSRFANWQ